MVTYEVNKFDEVVPIYGGRTSRAAIDHRELTEFEKQLLEQIKEMEQELEELRAKVDG